MKTSGIVRQVDKMGRVVIPKEIRSQLNIECDVDELEISVVDNQIILKKYKPACFFCDSLVDLVDYGGYMFCKDCIEKLNNSLENAE